MKRAILIAAGVLFALSLILPIRSVFTGFEGTLSAVLSAWALFGASILLAVASGDIKP